jgi:hypothetical protein
VLSTIAANQTNGLLATHHAVASSLLSGYHLAFLVGAATITTGMAVALVLLRPRDARRELQLGSTTSRSATAGP